MIFKKILLLLLVFLATKMVFKKYFLEFFLFHEYTILRTRSGFVGLLSHLPHQEFQFGILWWVLQGNPERQLIGTIERFSVLIK
jgi:hypothetical protein